jgi:hypothetical protein
MPQIRVRTATPVVPNERPRAVRTLGGIVWKAWLLPAWTRARYRTLYATKTTIVQHSPWNRDDE